MYKGKTIGVITAAHNEEQFIEEVISTMPHFVDRIYVTDDGSTDRTGAILAGMTDPRVVVTTHASRLGAGAAKISGFQRACEDKIDVVATMAGDGQMDPAVLDKILDPVVEGRADFTKGDRVSDPRYRQGMPPWRVFGSLVLTQLTRLASGYWHVSDPQNGYRAISRQVLKKVDVRRLDKGFACENDLLIRMHVAGAQVLDVPHRARYRGERSKIRYPSFIVKTIAVLLRGFVWRLWMERVRGRSYKKSWTVKRA